MAGEESGSEGPIRTPTEFRRRFGVGGRAPSVGLVAVGGKISYEEAAKLTIETADKSLGVLEDIRAEIKLQSYILAMWTRKACGLPLSEKQLAWLEQVVD